MRVFVTGATGFIGSAIVPELIGSGHEVVGLARSDRSAAALAAAGAEVHRGDLDDPESLRTGAAGADGVIHCAFIHDFTQLESSGRTDLRAVETFGAALEGTGRPLVVTSGTGLLAPGRVATEDDAADPASHAGHRVPSEVATLALAARGVRSSLVRLPPSVHGEGDHGFVHMLAGIARAKGVSAYPGDGANRWAATHRLDAAHLFRLALEFAPAASRLHAMAEEAVPVRDIAEAIGRYLDLPVTSVPHEQVDEHFGWLGRFLTMDVWCSTALTRQRFGWQPVQPGLIPDIEKGYYFTA